MENDTAQTSGHVGVNSTKGVDSTVFPHGSDTLLSNIRRIGDVKWDEISKSPEHAKICWEVAVEEIKEQRDIIKDLKQTARELKRKVRTLKTVIKTKKKRYRMMIQHQRRSDQKAATMEGSIGGETEMQE